MYTIDWTGLFSRPPSANPRRADPRGRATPTGHEGQAVSHVHPTVKKLGVTSFFTDISSEMVSSVLPVYLVLHLRLTPLAFGFLDGLYQGVAAVVRLAGGFMADRRGSYKGVAAAGYGLSAICKFGLLAAGNTWAILAAVIAIDRTGKGIRTAPRDALISLTSAKGNLAAAFGVHRSFDAAGAMLGPFVSFLLLTWMPGAFDALFVISACVAAIGLGVLLCFVENPVPAAGAAPVDALSIRATLRVLTHPRARAVFVAGTILSVATLSESFLFLALQRQVGLNMGMFPLLYVGVSLCHCACALPAGRLADSRGRERVYLCGQLLLLTVYVLLLTPMSDMARVLGSVALLGAYHASTDGVLAAMVSTVVPSHATGTGLALLASVTDVARLLAAVLFGAVWMWLGMDPAVTVFAVGLALAVAAAAVALRFHSRSEDR